jgi:hypothetical protein
VIEVRNPILIALPHRLNKNSTIAGGVHEASVTTVLRCCEKDAQKNFDAVVLAL